MIDYSLFSKTLETLENIVVIPHTKHDGDALGSSLGTAHLLHKLGKNVQVILDTEIASYLNWMPHLKTYGMRIGQQKEACIELISKADGIILTDFSATRRVSEDLEQAILGFKEKRLIIDHHEGKKLPHDLAIVDILKPSTCELVYEIIENNGWTNLIDQELATLLYTGMVTDTGSFKFASTTARTHEIAALLYHHDIDHAGIQSRLFDNVSLIKYTLLGHALQHLDIEKKYGVGIFYLQKEELEPAQKGDTDGLINQILSIEGVQMAVALFDYPDQEGIKMSFRSLGDIAVNKLAEKHFMGGGHKNAAGGFSNKTISETVLALKNSLPSFFEI